MKRRTIRSLAALFAVLCLLTASLSAGAVTNTPSPIQPRWTGASDITADLAMNPGGRAHCCGKVVLRSGYTGDMTMTLQRSTDQRTWSEVTSWSTSGSGTLELEKDYYVPSGYYYRVEVKVDVKNSSGKLIESPSKASSVSAY